MIKLFALIFLAFIQPVTVRDPRVPVHTIVGNDGMVTYIMQDGSWRKASMKKGVGNFNRAFTKKDIGVSKKVKIVSKPLKIVSKPRPFFRSRFKSKLQNDIEEKAHNSRNAQPKEVLLIHDANEGKDYIQ